ncbi:MAG: hypothetical protein ABR502_06755 [Chitinophagaceae bacterium]
MKNNSPDFFNSNKQGSTQDDAQKAQARKKLDLQDSPEDEEKLKSEEVIIDLPDVKDIPGQEFVHPAPLGMLGDTTISSADEEGEGLFEDDDEDETNMVMGTEADITREEKQTLETSDDYKPTRDEDNLRGAALDNSDFEGDPLNEGSFGDGRSGKDLDIPGSETDDLKENIGAEDEENNEYSLNDDDNAPNTEGIP